MKKDNFTISHFIVNIIKGILTSLITLVCMSVISSGIVSTLPDPLSYLKIFIVITFYLSFLSGSIVASFNSNSPLLITTLYSITLILILVICGMLFPNSPSMFSVTAIISAYITSPAACLALVYIISNRKGKRPHFKKRRYQ